MQNDILTVTDITYDYLVHQGTDSIGYPIFQARCRRCPFLTPWRHRKFRAVDHVNAHLRDNKAHWR